MPVSKSSTSFIRNQADTANAMDGVKKLLEAKLREAEMLTKEGIEDVVKEIFFESQSRAPVDTGAMMDSAYTEVVDLGGGKIIGEVGYDRDNSAPHSVYVHEINANHPIGQWKFLLAGANAVESKIPRILQASINKMFKG